MFSLGPFRLLPALRCGRDGPCLFRYLIDSGTRSNLDCMEKKLEPFIVFMSLYTNILIVQHSYPIIITANNSIDDH